jgi:hypothetical protein
MYQSVARTHLITYSTMFAYHITLALIPLPIVLFLLADMNVPQNVRRFTIYIYLLLTYVLYRDELQASHQALHTCNRALEVSNQLNITTGGQRIDLDEHLVHARAILSQCLDHEIVLEEGNEYCVEAWWVYLRAQEDDPVWVAEVTKSMSEDLKKAIWEVGKTKKAKNEKEGEDIVEMRSNLSLRSARRAVMSLVQIMDVLDRPRALCKAFPFPCRCCSPTYTCPVCC